MQTILEILLNGIVQGAVYSLAAFGLAMVYGTARVLNFAHGSFFYGWRLFVLAVF